jgi:hypothetical protein
MNESTTSSDEMSMSTPVQPVLHDAAVRYVLEGERELDRACPTWIVTSSSVAHLQDRDPPPCRRPAESPSPPTTLQPRRERLRREASAFVDDLGELDAEVDDRLRDLRADAR